MSVQIARRWFNVAEYERMGEAGILSEDDRTELLEGEIVEMSPIGRRHAAVARFEWQRPCERDAARFPNLANIRRAPGRRGVPNHLDFRGTGDIVSPCCFIVEGSGQTQPSFT